MPERTMKPSETKAEMVVLSEHMDMHLGGKKPLVEMRDNIRHQHRIIYDSLQEVNRLLDEAGNAQTALEHEGRSSHNFFLMVGIPVAVALLSIAIFIGAWTLSNT